MHRPVQQRVLCCALLEHGLLGLFLPWCISSGSGLLSENVDVESGYHDALRFVMALRRSTRETTDAAGPAFKVQKG